MKVCAAGVTARVIVQNLAKRIWPDGVYFLSGPLEVFGGRRKSRDLEKSIRTTNKKALLLFQASPTAAHCKTIAVKGIETKGLQKVPESTNHCLRD